MPPQEKQSKEDSIVGLLEKITKLTAITSSQLPSQKKFKEMQDELEYKKMQLENTQTTQERLKEVGCAEGRRWLGEREGGGYLRR